MKKSPKIYRTSLQSLRILSFSDCRIQNIPNFINWIASQTPYDLIIYAGDDIIRFRPSSAINYFEQLASRAKFGLAAIIGNDDKPNNSRRLISGKNVHEVHSRPLVIGNFYFIGSEGASGRIGQTLYTEKQIAKHLKSMIPNKTKKTVIIISHVPPHGCLDVSLRFGLNHEPRHIGSEALKEFIETHSCVSLVICGHSHYSGGSESILANATVINIASHDNADEPLRFATSVVSSDGKVKSELSEFHKKRIVISGIGPHYRKRLAMVGINSNEELANSNPETVGNAIGWHPSKVEILIMRARSLVHKSPVILKPVHVPDVPRLYLDIETNRDQSFCWLIGIGSDEDDTVTQFKASSIEEERQMLHSMVKHVDSFQDFSILHFGSFDRRVLKNRLKFYKIAIPPVLELSIDVYQELYYSIALPILTYSLTEVAKYFGYSFIFPRMDGRYMLNIYEISIREAITIPEILFNKNKEDVLALRYLVQNISKVYPLPAVLQAP